VRQSSEGNSLRRQLLAVSRRGCVTLCLQVRSHLPGQHLNEAGAVHADRLPVVGGVVHRDELSSLIHSTARHNSVAVIEGQMIKALRQDEDFRHTVAAST
jgi:hypothetical protein